MTNMINSIDKYPVSNSGIAREDIQDKLNKSKEAVTDNFESNSAVKTMSGGTSSDVLTKTVMLLPPLMITDRFIDSRIGGPESKSLLKKIANLGDGIARTFHLENLNGGKLKEFIKNNRFTKYFTTEYMAVPKASIARAETMATRYSKELAGHLASLKDNPEFAGLLEDGATALTEETKNFIKNINPANAAKDSGNLLKATEELISKGIDNIKEGGMLADPVNLSTIKNKLTAASSKMGETAIGSGLAKGALKAKNLFTFGGGMLSLAFTANALIQATKAAKEAPKGEKRSTFMHVLSEQYIGILLFQPSINLLYKAGGNKYRGMTVEAREALKNLVATTNVDENITKEAIKVARLQRNLLIKGVNKDEVAKLAGKTLKEAKNLAKGMKSEANLKLWERPLKFFGRILNAGLDDIKKAKFKELPILGKVKLPKPTLKGFAGGLARFALIMFIIQPIIQKPVTKLCHKLFGEPKTYLEKHDKGKSKDNKQQVQTPQQAEPQASPVNNTETNLIKRFTGEDVTPSNQVNASVNAPEGDSEQAIPAFNLLGKKNKEEEKYIPSIQVDNSYVLVQEKATNDKVKSILKKTDATKNKVLKLLNK